MLVAMSGQRGPVLDRADWHLEDAGSWQRAAAHIAPVWVHLVEHGYGTADTVATIGGSLPLDRARTPTQLFGEFADYALIRDDFDEAGNEILDRYQQYLGDLEEGIVHYARDGDGPYSIIDSWENVAEFGSYIGLPVWGHRFLRAATRAVRRIRRGS